jgi:fibronectin type 3 domain-containing protein
MKRFFDLALALLLATLMVGAVGLHGQQKKNLKVTATAHSVTLNWTQSTVPAGAPAVTSNNVYRGATSGSETALSSSVGAIVTYTDTTVTAGSSYCYEVTAVNSAGESPKSNEVCVQIPNQVAPNAPTGLQAAAQ